MIAGFFSSRWFGFLVLALLFLGMGSWHSLERPPAESKPPSVSSQKRLHRLEQRLQRTHRPQQRARLERKIQTLRQEHTDQRNPLWGIGGFMAAILAFIFIIMGFVMVTLFTGGTDLVFLIAFMYAMGLSFAIVGLLLSGAGFLLNHYEPEKYSGAGFAIAGFLICGLLIALFFLGAFR